MAASSKAPRGGIWTVALGLTLILGAAVLLVPSWTCAPFRMGDLFDPGELPVPLPPNCVSSSDEPSAATTDSLETQRQQMGLPLIETVSCRIPTSIIRVHGYDPQWTQKMYVGGALRYKRHVLIASTEQVPGGTLFVVERCLMPWWKYVDSAGTDCWSELEFWK